MSFEHPLHAVKYQLGDQSILYDAELPGNNGMNAGLMQIEQRCKKANSIMEAYQPQSESAATVSEYVGRQTNMVG